MNFLEAQVKAKTSGVYIWFALLHGDFDTAQRLAIGRLRMAQFIQEFDSILITKLIAVAIRSIAAADLIRFAVSAPMTIEQCDAFGDQLNKASSAVPKADDVSMRDFEYPVDLPMSERIGIANFLEAGTRYQTAAARIQLARAILASRRALIATGNFPDLSTSGSLAPILPNGLPADPFTFTTAPRSLLADITSQTMKIYSIGPDTRDDHGAPEYDPTNGTVSIGDITAELPRTPKYPFPKEGVHLDTTEALQALFPIGLPPDTYADTRGPLSIAQTTGSVVVFSYGPDTNESEATGRSRSVPKGGIMGAPLPTLTGRSPAPFPGTPLYDDSPYIPTIQYDPTNGTVSKGDLITTLTKSELPTVRKRQNGTRAATEREQ
jgi:hypothetical protein